MARQRPPSPLARFGGLDPGSRWLTPVVFTVMALLLGLSFTEAIGRDRPSVAIAGVLIAALMWLSSVRLTAGGIGVGVLLTVLVLLPPDTAGVAVHGSFVPLAVAGFRQRPRFALGLGIWYTAALASAAWRRTDYDTHPYLPLYIVLWGFLFTIMWLLGRFLRQAQLAADAQRLNALREQRLLIARELHDNVAQGLLLLSLRSEEARADGSGVLDAAEVRASCQLALADLRRLLVLLRSSTEEMTAPTSRSLEEIVSDAVQRLEAAGFTVDVRIEDGTADNSPLAHTTLDGVLREAVSNVVKHGSTEAPCQFLVDASGTDSLEVVLINTPNHQAAPAHHDPLGIVGMRERVERIGGTLDAGMGATSWLLRIALPLDTRPIGQEVRR